MLTPDLIRELERAHSSRQKSAQLTLGAALVFTAPGIPMIFQGQEFLEDEYFRDEAPIDWSQLETYSGINAIYRDLIRLRRNWFNHTRGLRGQHVNNADKFSSSTVGKTADPAMMSWWSPTSPTAPSIATSWASAAGRVARPLQQRLAGLQQRLRESVRLQHLG